MDKVFITHSKHDAPILTNIHVLINIVGVEPIWYRYDKFKTDTAWQEIRGFIQSSNALFVVLSNNLSSSSHTQNWVGWEVGVACAFNKRVYVFQEINSNVLFPIPYLTDYVLYDLNNPQLSQLISAVAKAYKLEPQFASIIGGGVIGGAITGGLGGLIIGAIVGGIVGKPTEPPYINLMCYHLDCKTKFKMYVWLDQFKCPACCRVLRFQQKELQDGKALILPMPNSNELSSPYYCWYDQNGQYQLFTP